MILGEQGLRSIKGEINLFDYSLKYQKKVAKKRSLSLIIL